MLDAARMPPDWTPRKQCCAEGLEIVQAMHAGRSRVEQAAVDAEHQRKRLDDEGQPPGNRRARRAAMAKRRR